MDLDRHTRQVHSADNKEEKGRFHCDHGRCTSKPLGREDHCRDHYRDYHKEDLVKRGLNPERVAEWLRARPGVDLRWWRCDKCLKRVIVETNGWECPECNRPCEIERKEYRIAKMEKSKQKGRNDKGDEENTENDSRGKEGEEKEDDEKMQGSSRKGKGRERG